MSTSVLILKPSSLGDIIHTLPAVAFLKQARPDWKLTWLVNTEWGPLLAGNRTVARTIVFPRRTFRGVGGAFSFLKWARAEVRELRPDLVLDFQGLLRMALVARLSRAREILGLGDAREGASLFYDRRTPRAPENAHSVERYLSLAKLALSVGEDVPVGPPSFPLPPGTPPEGGELAAGESYVLLHPFSRGRGKSLSVEQVRSFCETVAPQTRVIVVGKRAEGKALILPAGCSDYLNRTNLEELLWLLRRAAFVVSVDSGPMHLAAALHRPLVSIHTWSDPRKVGPYRPDAWVWKSGRLFRFSERHDMERGFYDLASVPLRPKDLGDLAALACR